MADDEPKDLATALVRISNQQFQNDGLREIVRALRIELAVVTAERDYLLTGCSDSEIRVMRSELAKESA